MSMALKKCCSRNAFAAIRVVRPASCAQRCFVLVISIQVISIQTKLEV